MGLKFCSDFFWVRNFGKDFFLGGGGLTKSETQGSRFYVKQLYHDAKLSGILLNYDNYFFLNWTFLLVTFWAVGLFLGQGLA